jgi:hypothetical protein
MNTVSIGNSGLTMDEVIAVARGRPASPSLRMHWRRWPKAESKSKP